MKKMFLILSVIIGLTVSYSSYAKSNFGLSGNSSSNSSYSGTYVRLVATSSDSFHYYCYYQKYNPRNGFVISTYTKSYFKLGFVGCPSS